MGWKQDSEFEEMRFSRVFIPEKNLYSEGFVITLCIRGIDSSINVVFRRETIDGYAFPRDESDFDPARCQQPLDRSFYGTRSFAPTVAQSALCTRKSYLARGLEYRGADQ